MRLTWETFAIYGCTFGFSTRSPSHSPEWVISYDHNTDRFLVKNECVAKLSSAVIDHDSAWIAAKDAVNFSDIKDAKAWLEDVESNLVKARDEIAKAPVRFYAQTEKEGREWAEAVAHMVEHLLA